MTEEEWLTSDDVVALLTHVESCNTPRKRRLFLLDCAQRVCHLLGFGTRRHPIRKLLFRTFELVEGGTPESIIALFNETCRQAAQDAIRLGRLTAETGGETYQTIRHASREAVASNLIRGAQLGESGWRMDWDNEDRGNPRHSEAMRSLREQVCRENIPVLRCIVGNPFRPVAFEPRWRTEHTVGIALKMYDDRYFAAMPILADALEEAGCDSEAVLTHCREPGPHARGCWVVDGVLGKR